MDRRLWLVGALTFCGPAVAGYAQLAAPTGWSVTPAGLQVVRETAVTSAWRTAANNGVYASLNAGLNIGGKAIVVPAAARVAANAGVFAARAAFMNPAVFAALAIGSAAYTYFTEDGDLKIDGSGASARWMKTDHSLICPTGYFPFGSQCKGYSLRGSYTFDPVVKTKEEVCANFGATLSGNTCYKPYWSNDVEENFAAPQPGQQPAQPATEDDLIAETEGRPVPAKVFNDWPQEVPLDIPLETPIINPKPISVPEPQTIPVPLPQPMTVPNGLPQPVVPATDPATWRQPVTEVQPANSPTSPWQVDLVPKDVITTDGKPVTEPGTDPGPNPNPSDEVEPTEPVDQPGLCDEYPDILACAKPQLGKVSAQPVNNQSKTLTINADTGWGPSNSACPAPKTAVVAGVSLQMPYTLLCDFATAIRPLLIAFAWLSAAVSFIGFGRKD